MSIEINIDTAGLERAASDADILAKKLERADDIFYEVFEDAANVARGSVHKITGQLQSSINVRREGANGVRLVVDAPYAVSEFRRGGSHAAFIEDAIRMLESGTKGMVADIIEGSPH